MKKENVPQDESALKDITRELVYAKDEKGNFVKVLSTGWNTKKAALDITWENIKEELEEAKELVRNKKKSPIFYWMIKNLMDKKLLASYVGYRRWRVSRHLKPRVFDKLSDSVLEKYASTFEISLNELKNYNIK